MQTARIQMAICIGAMIASTMAVHGMAALAMQNRANSDIESVKAPALRKEPVAASLPMQAKPPGHGNGITPAPPRGCR